MIFAPLIVALGAADTTPAYLEKDRADFEVLWSGTWSNDRQVFFAEDAGMDSSTMAPRQEFSLVSAGEGRQGGLTLADGTDLTSAVQVGDGAILQTLSNGRGRTVCTLRWRRAGAQFSSTGEDEGCRTLINWGEHAPAGPLSLSLSDEALWFAATSGQGVPVEARFRRVRPFSCWVAVLRGAEHGDSGKGMTDWYFRRGVKLHDQGGVASITTDETPQRTVRLQLRDVDWTYGSRRPSLTLYVLGDDDRAVSYSWTEGGAERIGINLRWLQASCTHDPDQDDS